MNLILFKRSEISEDGKSVKLPDNDPRTKHIFKHLRKVDGDSVKVGIISGRQGKAIVRTDGDGGNRLEFENDLSVLTENEDGGNGDSQQRHEIVLLLSLPFPKRMKELWPQIASMGVTRICIIRGALSDPNYCKSSSITPKVYQPLVEEGMSQGCHTKEVLVDVEVGEVVSRAILEKLGLLKKKELSSCNIAAAVFLDCGDESMEPPPCRQVILNSKISRGRGRPKKCPTKKCVVLAIGSERGWTESEATMFHEAGYESASLGRSILRVDTAVIAGLGIVSATLDEMERTQQTTQKQKAEKSTRKRKQDTVAAVSKTATTVKQNIRKRKQDTVAAESKTATTVKQNTRKRKQATVAVKSETATTAEKTRGKNVVVSSEPPTDKLGEGLEWPEGWIKTKRKRMGGAFTGRCDPYWISPITKYHLRSLTEVRRFLKALSHCGGDEKLAKKEFRSRKKKPTKGENEISSQTTPNSPSQATQSMPRSDLVQVLLGEPQNATSENNNMSSSQETNEVSNKAAPNSLPKTPPTQENYVVSNEAAPNSPSQQSMTHSDVEQALLGEPPNEVGSITL